MQPSISLSNFKYCEDIARLTITYKRKKEVAQCVYLEAACLIFHNTLTFEFLSDKIILFENNETNQFIIVPVSYF